MTEHENYSDAAARPEAMSGHAATPAPLPPNEAQAVPGWYPYGDGTTRWWTGVNWVASSILQDHYQGPIPAASTSQPPYVFMPNQERKPMNHTFHLIATVLTFGLWGFVWAGIALLRAVTK